MHTYMHLHIRAQPAASVFADVYVGVKAHLCDIHTCPRTSAQNTCKVHVTLNAKKCTYICTHTHMYTHTYAHENTCACMTPSTRWSTDTKTHNLCTNMHTHTHTHVYQRIDVQIHTHMHIYTYIHVRTHTHIHIHTHTHTKCTYARTQARLERRRGSERARSRCRQKSTCPACQCLKSSPAPSVEYHSQDIVHIIGENPSSTTVTVFVGRTLWKNGLMRWLVRFSAVVCATWQSPLYWLGEKIDILPVRARVQSKLCGRKWPPTLRVCDPQPSKTSKHPKSKNPKNICVEE